MTTEPKEQQEPSMEEILSSIRRIIADEESANDEDGEREPQPDASKHADERARTDDRDDDDVLELTRVVRESGEVVDLKPAAAEPGRPIGEQADVRDASAGLGSDPLPHQSNPYQSGAHRADELPISDIRGAAMEQHETMQNKNGSDSLVSDQAAGVATGAFAKLSQAVQRTPPEVAIADESGRSIEQFVEDMIRPMLREWLEQHLPPLVERIVQKEIQKIARRAELD
jgi:cell pole-organizing protein PopZ